jgi:hypothetical protein
MVILLLEEKHIPDTLGLSKAGKFSGRAKSPGKLGTLRNVRSAVITRGSRPCARGSRERAG